MKQNTFIQDLDPDDPSLVKSLAKALNILSCFTPTEAEFSLAEISRRLSMPKSTTLNMLRTLEAFGYLRRVLPSMNYRLGYKIMPLNYCLQMSLPIIRYTLPFLEDLQSRTEKTIYLTTHIGGKVLYLEEAHQNNRMYTFSITGKTLHMHCTGCGKAMLAFLPKEEIRQIIATHGLPSFTANTITSEEVLYEELAQIRERGYAFDNEEEGIGVKCIAAPILNMQGYPTAAVSISGAASSMQEEQRLSFVNILLNTCRALSSNADQYPAGENLLLAQKK